jgi:hypothetical protein
MELFKIVEDWERYYYISDVAEVSFRAKNSYSIERRPIDYVPTAILWSCCGCVP